MPKFDRTGPAGMGSGTGRRMGPCCGEMGYGYGRGLGMRRFLTKKEESELLKEEAEVLEEELKAVKERISEIEGRE